MISQLLNRPLGLQIYSRYQRFGFDKGICYKMYENGKIEGFSEDAIVVNRIPTMILTVNSHYLNRSKSDRLPTSKLMSSSPGCSQGVPEYE